MIDQQYNTPVCHNRVAKYLSSTRVSELVQKGDEMYVSPVKPYKLVTKLSRQVPPSDGRDALKL